MYSYERMNIIDKIELVNEVDRYDKLVKNFNCIEYKLIKLFKLNKLDIERVSKFQNKNNCQILNTN